MFFQLSFDTTKALKVLCEKMSFRKTGFCALTILFVCGYIYYICSKILTKQRGYGTHRNLMEQSGSHASRFGSDLNRAYIYVLTTNKSYTENKTVESCGDLFAFDYNSCLNEQNRCYNMSHAIHNCSHLLSFSGIPNGRLGNIMFQIAALIGIASRHGYTPVIKTTFKLCSIFESFNRISLEIKNLQSVNERTCCQYNKQLDTFNHSYNWTLRGYFQSWKYFVGAEDRIRKAYTFTSKYRQEVDEYLKQIHKKGFIRVGVHVRRGDFLSSQHKRMGYTTAPVSYIERAQQYFYRKYKKVQFIFASNDIKWCKNSFTETNNYFSPFTDPATDMALLASCDHVIITSGSFGWWGAWLSGGVTIYYRGFPKAGSWLESQFNFEDYYPTDWIGMN